jgi:hypothetical protein
MHAVVVTLAVSLTPRWDAPRPDYTKLYAGLPLVDNAEHVLLFEATPETGTYSHGPVIERYDGAFHVEWNNSPFNEDGDGMRLLYSSSVDGRIWSEPVDIFPSMPASEFSTPGVGPSKIHHHAVPFVNLNGRLYAVSCVQRHGGYEIYPVPKQSLNYTLLRRVIHPAALYPVCPQPDPPSWCKGTMRWSRPAFGPMFWATDQVPLGMENVTENFGVRVSSEAVLNVDERADFELFRDQHRAREMSTNSCRGGACANTTGEQTVYSVPDSSLDVLLYRGTGGAVPAGWPGDQSCKNVSECVLLSSFRDTANVSAVWSPRVPTTIPDLGSNLNAGVSPNGAVFLVWNGVPRPHVNDTACDRLTPLRNPLTLALSSDGVSFDKAYALYNNTRPKRFCGSAKSFGPSYPKACAVTGQGPALDGIWTVYSINKEDVGVTFAPKASLV